jgi:hypothetical protein
MDPVKLPEALLLLLLLDVLEANALILNRLDARLEAASLTEGEI